MCYHFIAPEIAAACFSICVSLSISICSKIADRINSACASRNITKSPDEVEICKSPNATLLFSSETVLIFESGVSIDCLLINPLTPNNRLFVTFLYYLSLSLSIAAVSITNFTLPSMSSSLPLKERYALSSEQIASRRSRIS